MTEPDTRAIDLPSSAPPALIRASEQFNAGQFWESHETLEALWLHAPEPTKLFLQGIIQAAAACHHLVRGNYKGTMNLLGYALEKLHQREQVPAFHQWMDLEGFIRMLEESRQRVEALGPDRIGEFPPERIPTLNVLSDLP